MSSPLWFRSPDADAAALAESLGPNVRSDIVAVRSALAPPTVGLPRVAIMTGGVPVGAAWAGARALADAGTHVTLVLEPGQLGGELVGAPHAALCVRLDPSSFEHGGTEPAAALSACPTQLDGALLLLDIGQVHGVEAVDAIALAGMLSRIPDPSRWRGLIVAGTDAPSEALHQSRHLWSVLRGLGPRLRRWAEVGVCDAGPMDHAGRRLAYVGHSACNMFPRPSDDCRRSQHVTLAQRISEHRCFAGSSFSAGDAWIEACAEGIVATPDASTWRWAMWSHHVAQLTLDVAGLASPWLVTTRDV
jgi:hypothetical protein